MLAKRAKVLWVLACFSLATASAAGSSRLTDEPEAETSAPKLTVTTKVIPDNTPTTPPEFTVFKPKPGEHTTANELLLALETAGNSIQTLTADLRYSRRLNELEGGETQVRTGSLMFRTRPVSNPAPAQPADVKNPDAPAVRREFQIDFVRLEIDGKARDDLQTFIFDGEWLVERYPDQKEIHRRQVVAPGQIVDPLAIGEGPFPIPIGQKRDRILDRFDAYLADAGDGWGSAGRPNWIDSVYQLILVPKRGTDEARQYRMIRLWYVKDSLLPRMVRAEEANDSLTEVLLLNVETNRPLPAGAFDTVLPPGWNERVDNFRPQSDR